MCMGIEETVTDLLVGSTASRWQAQITMGLDIEDENDRGPHHNVQRHDAIHRVRLWDPKPGGYFKVRFGEEDGVQQLIVGSDDIS